MPKNDNAHALRMCASLEAVVGKEAAEAFAAQFPLSKSASVEKRAAWVNAVCAYLDSTFDKETVIRIRSACPCNDGRSIAAQLGKYRKKTGSVREFVELFNANEDFASLEYISENSLLFCYPTCYCACVKRAPEPTPISWCYCTLGNAHEIFRILLDREVRVELLETVRSGADRCAIRVEW